MGIAICLQSETCMWSDFVTGPGLHNEHILCLDYVPNPPLLLPQEEDKFGAVYVRCYLPMQILIECNSCSFVCLVDEPRPLVCLVDDEPRSCRLSVELFDSAS